MNFISLQIQPSEVYGVDVALFARLSRPSRSSRPSILSRLTSLLSSVASAFSKSASLEKAPAELDASERERQFLELTQRYGSVITRICFSYAGNAADMEDLRQDVLINIWNGLRYFKGDSSPLTWIYRVTLNTCVSMIRKVSRDVKTFSFSDIMTDRPDDEADSGYFERLERLHEMMAMLTPVDKAILTMRLDERSYDEIAEVTGLSVSNVATRLNRIKTKLKNRLKP